MAERGTFGGFDEETQRLYEEEASRRWGEKQVKESRQRWDSYSKEKQAAILAEGGAIYQRIWWPIWGQTREARLSSRPFRVGTGTCATSSSRP